MGKPDELIKPLCMNLNLDELIFCKPVFLQVFLFLHETMYCDHSFELAQQADSNEWSQDMVSWRSYENFQKCLLMKNVLSKLRVKSFPFEL